MKKTALRLAVFLALITVIALPHIVSAQQYKTPNLWPGGFWGPLVSCTGDVAGINPNPANLPPCTSLCNLIGTFINIIFFIISLCFFILAPIMFAVGGIMVMVSGANPEMLSTGKRILKAAAIGVIIVLCAYLIVATFISFLGVTGIGGFGSGGSGTITCVAQ